MRCSTRHAIVELSIRAAAVCLHGEGPRRFPSNDGAREGGTEMTQYLLSIYQPDGAPPPSVDLEKVMRDVADLVQEVKAGGAWVFNGGLHPASTATVVRLKDGDLLMTDGPFTEGKEHVGGLMIVRAPDLDAALEWAGKAARATTLPIEVRPFQEEVED